MKIVEIKDKNIWENFLLGCREKTFLSSWNWGTFQSSLENKIWRLGVLTGEILEGVALVVKIYAKRGNFLFVPHGPNIKNERKKIDVLRILFEKLKEISKIEKMDFIRIAPIFERNLENQNIFKELGFRTAPIHIHPELTWELNISFSEKEILNNMRKTTRYLIRKAEKDKQIIIREENNLEGLRAFYKIYLETKDRQGFVPFSFDYLKKEFSVFSAENQVSILLAQYQKEIVAGGIFIFWQKYGFYHHGASSKKHKKIPTSYLILWEAIKKAKERGCERFNFWGIAETDSSTHPWAGLTLFKKGFGGEKKAYVKTQDFSISKKYWINFLIESIRKINRRYY